MRERLGSKHARLKKSGVAKKKNNKETALAARLFLGQCYVCGKFGHNGSDFPDKKKKVQNRCGRRGHGNGEAEAKVDMAVVEVV